MVTPASGGNQDMQVTSSGADGIVVKKSLMEDEMFKDALNFIQEVTYASCF